MSVTSVTFIREGGGKSGGNQQRYREYVVEMDDPETAGSD